jgi:hypothetical protein
VDCILPGGGVSNEAPSHDDIFNHGTIVVALDKMLPIVNYCFLWIKQMRNLLRFKFSKKTHFEDIDVGAGPVEGRGIKLWGESGSGQTLENILLEGAQKLLERSQVGCWHTFANFFLHFRVALSRLQQQFDQLLLGQTSEDCREGGWWGNVGAQPLWSLPFWWSQLLK